jgi:hypothetical protein
MSKDLTLAYEWEVVILNALSKVGQVLHEKNFGGRRNADIYFKASDNPKANFVADITAISDEGADKNNPNKALSNMLHKLVKESGLRGNSFNLRVGRHPGPVFKGGPKVRSKLPGSARFSQTIFGKKFEGFIHRIQENPQKADQYVVKTDDADVEISYVPNQMFASESYSSYTELYSKTENTLYQALEDKASQLLGTDFKGPLGIFLCDGGSSLFSKRLTAGLSYTIDEVIQHFLSTREEIQFVVTCTTGRKNPYAIFPYGDNPHLNLIRFFAGPTLNQITYDLEGILKKMAEHLPLPESEPYNALKWLKGKNPDMGRSNWGGMQVSWGKETTKVRISARALLELLAGKVDQRGFFEVHGFIPSELRATRTENPFSTALQKGQLIHDVSMERLESEDDDWITFELKGPDPAIAPFEIPIKRNISTKKP